MEKIRLLIVDDDPGWLKGICAFLNKEEDFLITGVASCKEDALKFINNFDVDVILMDLNLSGDKYDGIEASNEILRIKKPKIIILTSFQEKEIITDAFVAGAVNYFCKDDYQGIPAAIRSAFYNRSPVEILGEAYSKLREESRFNALTSAEKEVYQLKKAGLTIAQIGETLNKSSSTIKKQVNKILKKLHVNRFDDLRN